MVFNENFEHKNSEPHYTSPSAKMLWKWGESKGEEESREWIWSVKRRVHLPQPLCWPSNVGPKCSGRNTWTATPWGPSGLPISSTFSYWLCVNNHWFGWRAYQWPLIRDDSVLFHYFQQIPTCWNLTHEGLVELTRCPSRAPNHASYAALQYFRDTRTLSGVSCYARWSQDSGCKPWICVCSNT